jgi:hypothetical protein
MTDLELGLVKYFIDYQRETNMLFTRNINISTKTQGKKMEELTLDDIEYIDIYANLFVSLITLDNVDIYKLLEVQKDNLEKILKENYYLDDINFYPIEIKHTPGWYTTKIDIVYSVAGKFVNIDAIKTYLDALKKIDTK